MPNLGVGVVGIDKYLNPRIRNMSSWQQVKRDAPDLLRHPVNTERMFAFKKWAFSRGFELDRSNQSTSAWSGFEHSSVNFHNGFDFHVFEDFGGRLQYVRNHPKILSILPGIVINEYSDPKAAHFRQITVLHSLPNIENGNQSLVSVYNHISTPESGINLGDPMPVLELSSPSKACIQHLHFMAGYLPADSLRRFFSVNGFDYRNTDNHIFPNNAIEKGMRFIDPLLLFPLDEPTTKVNWVDAIWGNLISVSEKPAWHKKTALVQPFQMAIPY